MVDSCSLGLDTTVLDDWLEMLELDLLPVLRLQEQWEWLVLEALLYQLE